MHALRFSPPTRSRPRKSSQGEQAHVGHAAAEGLLRAARSRSQASVDADCQQRRCKTLFRSQGEAVLASLQTKVRQKMRKETSYSSLVASFLNVGFKEDKVQVAPSQSKAEPPQMSREIPKPEPSNLPRSRSFADASTRSKSSLCEQASPLHPCAVDAEEGKADDSSSSRWKVYNWGSWVALDAAMQKELSQAANRSELRVAFSLCDVPYVADFKGMVLLNEATGRRRLLRFEAGHQDDVPPGSILKTMSQQGMMSLPSRCQVFLEGSGWKTMSMGNSPSMEADLLQGIAVFDTQAHGCQYRINLEVFKCTNLQTGQTSALRLLEGNCASPSAVQLSRYFSLLAGSDKAALLAEEAATSQWLATALTTTTETEEGRELILAGAGQLFSCLAISRSGVASRDEWVHYWLLRGSAPSHYALTILQGRLSKLARRCPEAQVLGTILHLFLDADADADGEISRAEMAQCCKKFSQRSWESLGLPGAPSWLRADSKGIGGLEAETMNYFEFASELVGRQPHDVWLYQYDISKGLLGCAAPAEATSLPSLEGVWHTSIVVYGKEYWYGGRCFESKLQTCPFGEPAKRIYLGATRCSQAELWDKMDRELCREYTCSSYDVVRRNCHHFSQEVAWFLLNKRLPEEIWLQPTNFASSVAEHRPLLNRWLGGFASKVLNGTDEARASDVTAAEDQWSRLSVGSLVSYVREGMPNIIAEVISKDAGACDLWWWEPSGSQHGRFLEAAGVSKMQVTSLGRHTGRWRGRRATDPSSFRDGSGRLLR